MECRPELRRCASATARRSPDEIRPDCLARDAQGSADRGAQPRDSVHDGVLRAGLRAGVRLRVRPARAGRCRDAAAGILWIAIAFSGTLALGRAFERERQGETLRALLIAPIERPALYLGKLVGILILLAAVEAIVVPLVALMFQARALRSSGC